MKLRTSYRKLSNFVICVAESLQNHVLSPRHDGPPALKCDIIQWSLDTIVIIWRIVTLWHYMVGTIWVNLGSGNGLLPDVLSFYLIHCWLIILKYARQCLTWTILRLYPNMCENWGTEHNLQYLITCVPGSDACTNWIHLAVLSEWVILILWTRGQRY